MVLKEERYVFSEKSVPFPVLPTQIPHDIAGD